MSEMYTPLLTAREKLARLSEDAWKLAQQQGELSNRATVLTFELRLLQQQLAETDEALAQMSLQESSHE